MKKKQTFFWGFGLLSLISVFLLVNFGNCRNLPGTSGKPIEPDPDVSEEPKMVMVWVTLEASDSIELPLKEGYQYDFTVDWGDGSEKQTILAWNDPNRIHNYAEAGEYTVTLEGLLQAWYFNFDATSEVMGNKEKIRKVLQFGNMGWVDLSYAFAGCTQLTTFQGGVTNLVTNMQGMFFAAIQVKPNTSNWDTSSVTDMRDMFNEAQSANPNTSNWDTSNVTTMRGMFAETLVANPDTSSWDTSNVTNMAEMFLYANQANPNTSTWAVHNVTTMEVMFKNTSSANPDVTFWQTNNLINASRMFENATQANPNFSNWNFQPIDTMEFMMTGATAFSAVNYSNMLIQAYETGEISSVPLGAHQTNYLLYAQEARDQLIDDYNWIISDNGLQ